MPTRTSASHLFFTLTQTRQSESSDVVALDRIASQPFASPPPEAHFFMAPSRSTKFGQGEIMNWVTTTLCYFVILFYFLPLGCGMRKSNTKQGSDLPPSSFVRGSQPLTCPSFLPRLKMAPARASRGEAVAFIFLFSLVIIVLEMRLAAAESARNVFYGQSLTGQSAVRRWGCRLWRQLIDCASAKTTHSQKRITAMLKNKKGGVDNMGVGCSVSSNYVKISRFLHD